MFGGAVYVEDLSNSGGCSPDKECFIQILAPNCYFNDPNILSKVNVHFLGNTATEQGSNLFGGLLDRCISSPFSEVYQKQKKVTAMVLLTLLSSTIFL